MNSLKNERKQFWILLLKLALPIAFQHLLINSLTFVDTLFMSQLGDVALSASGMAAQWNWLMSMISFGICSGTALFVAQFWGAGEIGNIRRTYSISVLLGVIVALLFTVPATVIPNVIMKAFNRDADVVAAGSSYLAVAAIAYPATVVSSILCSVLRSTEKVKLPMVVSCISTLLNIILDYALVFGKLGLPEMGMRGAALATAISAWVGIVILIAVSLVQDNILIMPFKEFFGFCAADVKNFLKKASPVILNELAWGLGTVVNNAMFANTGYENYAACTILRTIEGLAIIMFIGLNDGGAVIVGKTIGEGDYDRAYRSAKRLVISAPAISMVLAFFVIGFRDDVIYLFNMSGNITDTTVMIAGQLVVIYAIELCFRNIPYTMVCAIFRAGGDSLTGAKYDIICLWLMAIPAIFISAFVLKLPFPAVFLIGYLLEDVPKSIMCLRHFVSRKWIKPVVSDQKV